MEGHSETQDAICGGTVRVVQSAHGYRFNLDPVLLAHFVEEEGVRGPLIDLGTGSGIIPLILARKFGRSDLLGLELQPRLYALAQRNVQLNACEERVALALGDLRDAPTLFMRESFSHVVTNPPYRATRAGLRSPVLERAIARHEIHCDLEDVLASATFLLRDRGSLSMIYPAPRMAELLASLRAHSLEPRRLRLVHPRAHRPAKLVLVSSFSDEQGGVTRHPFSPHWPLETLSTTRFSEDGGRTRIDLEWEPINATPEEMGVFANSHAGMNQGWNGTFERLVAYLAETGA